MIDLVYRSRGSARVRRGALNPVSDERGTPVQAVSYERGTPVQAVSYE